MTDLPGYHLRAIPRGTYGELSKLKEELAELEDAHAQGVTILCLVELSDLLGALEGYLHKYFPGMTLKDIRDMQQVTKRAFENGKR